MKVAVSATGGNLDSTVSPRFGRCPYYVIVDTETMSFEAIPNTSMSAPSGAGIGAAQLVAERGAEAVLTGAVGPNAMAVLSQTGIKMVTGAQGSVRQAALMVDDTDALDMMGGLLPYSPRIQDEAEVNLPVYDWVSSEFDDLARACGVYKYRMVQVYQAKSILTDDVEKIAGTASRLVSEIARWDLWMGFRLGALSALVKE